MSEEVGFDGDSEEQSGFGRSDSALASLRRSKMSFRNRVPRPTSRRLFKHDLADQDKRTKESKAARNKEEKRMNEVRRKEKAAVRRANVPKKQAKSNDTTSKAAKLTGDLGSDDAGLEIREARVLIDLTDIDVEEYECFSD